MLSELYVRRGYSQPEIDNFFNYLMIEVIKEIMSHKKIDVHELLLVIPGIGFVFLHIIIMFNHIYLKIKTIHIKICMFSI